MGGSGEAIIRAARDCVGVRFRPQGRDPAHGLDCIGLAGFAFGQAGMRGALPQDYALRGSPQERVVAGIEAAGPRAVAIDRVGAGDLLLCAAGPGQWHLAVWTGAGFVHADAALRRVVETPGWPRWPVIGAWRLDPEQESE